MLALCQDKKQPAEWAQALCQTLQTLGQKLLKDDKTLESAEENLAELTAQAAVCVKTLAYPEGAADRLKFGR